MIVGIARRRPARPDAGAGRHPLRPALPLPRSGSPRRPPARSPSASTARSTTTPLWPRSPRAWTSSPTSSRTCRWRRPAGWPSACRSTRRRRRLEVAQDRVAEKQLRSRGRHSDVPAFAAVGRAGRSRFGQWQRIGLPAVLKTRRFGYDGKGQAVIRSHGGRRIGVATARRPAADCSKGSCRSTASCRMLAVRGRDGARRASTRWCENHHRRRHPAPSRWRRPRTCGRNSQARAEQYATAAFWTPSDYVGVLAIEFFEVGGELLANEMAPRVHNSGHWTIEGARDEPVREPPAGRARLAARLDGGRSAQAAMLNLIGALPDVRCGAGGAGCSHVHLYGKAPRPGRKLGHVTVLRADGAEQALARLAAARQVAGG